MKKNRRYACNRLYIGTEYTSQSVVEINLEGQVERFSPLTTETPSTEWVGGVIVISNQKELPLYDDFKGLLQSLADDEEGAKYAWHISQVDFRQESLTQASIIRRL